MVSDLDLIARLREFLRSSDLNTTSTATVRRKLEEDFEVDLTDKKAFIREQVDLFLQSEQERLAEEAEPQDGEDDQTAEIQSQQTNEDVDDDEKVEETSNGKGKRRSVINLFSFSHTHIFKFTIFGNWVWNFILFYFIFIFMNGNT